MERKEKIEQLEKEIKKLEREYQHKKYITEEAKIAIEKIVRFKKNRILDLSSQ